MKTSIIKLIVTIAAVGMLANAALAKNGKSGGNGGGGGNRSMFKLNSGSGNGNGNRNLSSSSSGSSNNNKFFNKFKSSGSNNGSSSHNNGSSIASKVLKLSGNKNGSSQPVFKLNGNNSNKNNSIFSHNKDSHSNKLFSGNKFFNKNDKHDHHDGLFSKHCHNGFCYPKSYHYCHSYPSYPCYGHLTSVPVVALGYEPLHSNYVVMPGDTLFSIAFNEYGTSLPAKHIAAFNGLGDGSGLAAGRILNLPSVSPSGSLAPSGAPIADALRTSPINADAMRPAAGGPVGPMAGPAGPMGGPMGPMTGPVGPMGTPPVGPQNMTAPRPQIAVGSTLQVDGQTFGDKPGAARLLVGGVALKIEIVEWFGSAIKIRIPQLDLAGPSSGEIEIMRADGSLAAKTPVELIAGTPVALAR